MLSMTGSLFGLPKTKKSEGLALGRLRPSLFGIEELPEPGRRPPFNNIIFAVILGNIHLASLNINARNVYDVHACSLRHYSINALNDLIIFSNCTLLLLLMLIASNEQNRIRWNWQRTQALRSHVVHCAE